MNKTPNSIKTVGQKQHKSIPTQFYSCRHLKGDSHTGLGKDTRQQYDLEKCAIVIKITFYKIQNKEWV
jgi:hypothetical protein